MRGAGGQGFGRSFGGRDGPQRAGFNGGQQGGRLGGRVTRPGGGSSGFNDRDSGIHRRVTLQREDLDKPVLRLDDPASVPKGRSYFEHDSRGADEDPYDRRGGRRDDWRDRRSARMYDPRFDYGGERGRRDRRPRIDYDREERRAAAPLGWRNASGHDDRETTGRTFSNRGYDDEYSRPRKRPAADPDVWEHDKFFEVLDQEQEELQSIVKKEAEEYAADDVQERAESADSGPHAMVVDSGRQPA